MTLPPTAVSALLPDALSREQLAALSDADLLSGQRAWIATQRRAALGAAQFAAEIARRSSRDLGHAGLAQREGARGPEQLIERLAGISPDEARAIVRIGELMAEAANGDVTSRAVVDSVQNGELSMLSAHAIRVGLGEPSSTVSSEALDAAAELLVAVASEIPVRQVAAQARAIRDELDAAGVADRERLRFERRFLRVTPQADGMTRLTGLLDPESAAIVVAAFDQITSPRRGGPRFVDPVSAERSQRIVDDPRSTDQLLADAFVELVRIAGAADDGRVFVQRRPAVQVHVSHADLESGEGAAQFEGQSAAVSIATARRQVCAAGAVPILFDGETAIDVGRTSRLHTVRQRVALAARDGGCRAAGCDRPPSWCEVHHPEPWAHGGETSLANGILLCRFHHRWVHEQGCRVEQRADGYVAMPPEGTRREPLPMPAHHRPWRGFRSTESTAS